MRLDAIGLAIGDLIESLDINPLIVRGDDAIVVDALLIERKHDDDGLPLQPARDALK